MNLRHIEKSIVNRLHENIKNTTYKRELENIIKLNQSPRNNDRYNVTSPRNMSPNIISNKANISPKIISNMTNMTKVTKVNQLGGNFNAMSTK